MSRKRSDDLSNGSVGYKEVGNFNMDEQDPSLLVTRVKTRFFIIYLYRWPQNV